MADVSVFQSLLTSMNNLLTEMQQKLEAGQSVELGSTTLTALETITAAISNWPSDFPDASVLAKLETIRSLLAATLTVSVSNHPTDFPDSAVLSKLEAIRTILASVQTVSVNNHPTDFPDTASLAKLEAIRTILAGNVAVDVQDWPSDFPDVNSLNKLEAIRAILAGTVNVDTSGSAISVTNHPSDFPDASSIAKLTDVLAKQGETLDTLALVMLDILERLPRLDGNKRVMVSHAESNPTVSIAASQTIATVTTVGTVTTMSNQTNIGGRDAAQVVYALSNAGAHSLYEQIIVS